MGYNGRMVSRSLSFVARLSGEVDPSLGQAFQAVDTEASRLEQQIRETAARQQELTAALRRVDEGRESYEDIAREIRQTERRSDDLIQSIDRQRAQLAELNQGSREYDTLQGRIRQAERRSDRLTESLETQRERLREVDRGVAAYDDMQRELRQTERESDRLNRSLAEQRDHMERNAAAVRRYRGVALAAFGALTAGAVGVTAELRSSGQEYARLIQVADSTGIEIAEIERLQRQARVQGHELEAIDFREFANRIGETQAEVNRRIAEGGDPLVDGIGAAGEALRDLGFDVQRVSNRDLPAIIARLGELDQELREFYGQEIFGGGEFEALGAALDVPPEILARLEQIPTTSRETAEAARLANAEMEAMLTTTRQLSRDAATAFVPVFEAAAAVLVPIAGTLADIARNNPALIQALAATVAGVAGLSAAVWLLNSALAVRAALSGPVGWAALGVAATVGGGIAIGGALAARNATDPDAVATDQERDRQATASAIELSTYRGVKQGAAENARDTEETLRNILPQDCPEEVLAEAIDRLTAALTPEQQAEAERQQFAPAPELQGLTPQEEVRLRVAENRLPAQETAAQAQAARSTQVIAEANAATREAAIRDPEAANAPPVENPVDAAHRLRVLQARDNLRDPGERVSIVDRPGELPVTAPQPVAHPPAETPAPTRTERAAADPFLRTMTGIGDSINRLGHTLSFGLLGSTQPILTPAEGDTIANDLRQFREGDTVANDLRQYHAGDTVANDLRQYHAGDAIANDLRQFREGDTVANDLRQFRGGDRVRHGDTAQSTYTDSRTEVNIDSIVVQSGATADDTVSELRAALETARLGGL